MSITKNDSYQLETDNGAYMFANFENDYDAFLVSLTANADDHARAESLYFDADACREAAAFFQQLAEELDRRV